MTRTNSVQLDAMSALAEPTRRALYEHVVAQHDWVSRDEAAEALALRKGIAAHHLDRLETAGLLVSSRQRRNGRTGPGAGRPAKVYRRSETDHDVSLPPRRYDLAGRLLAEAADRSRIDDVPIADAIDEAAKVQGANLAARVRARVPDGAATAAIRSAFFDELTESGFEPAEVDSGDVVLRNCPFHQLSKAHTELICGMNETVLATAADRCPAAALSARLEPMPGACCVRFRLLDRPGEPVVGPIQDPPTMLL